MKLLLSLIELFVISHWAAVADDFIYLSKQKAWKVKRCALVGEVYKVTPCLSNTECPKGYSKSEYSCLKSISCGSSFLGSISSKSEKFKLTGQEENGVFFFKPDVNNSATLGVSTNPAELDSIKNKFADKKVAVVSSLTGELIDLNERSVKSPDFSKWRDEIIKEFRAAASECP